jgi:16S rRNA (uracil1498-N3)-methyltransferase
MEGAASIQECPLYNSCVHARFHAPDAREPDQVIRLASDEAAHLTRVLRLGPGDDIRIFNGRGGEFSAVVEIATKDEVRVRVGQSCAAAREARVAITLGQAVLRGEQMDEVVRDAVMIGAAAIQPVLTVRCEVGADTLERSHRRERWERVAVASAKQCGRAVVPAVLSPLPFEALLASWPASAASEALMLVEPGASAAATSLERVSREPPQSAFVAVGPEGGWAPEEIAAVPPAWRRLTMGGRTLRARSMALVVLSALYAWWGEF